MAKSKKPKDSTTAKPAKKAGMIAAKMGKNAKPMGKKMPPFMMKPKGNKRGG